MHLCRLIYRSSYQETLTLALVKNIEDVSQENNNKLGITGFLVGNKSGFMQVLEGEEGKVNSVFQNICSDNRHGDIEIISYSRILERAFPEWAMKCVSLGLVGRILGQRLKDKYGEQDGDIVLPSDGHKAFSMLFDLSFILKKGEIAQ